MKLIGKIFKMVLATLGCVYIFRGDTIFYQIVLFALCYGLITYYGYCIKTWIEDGFEDDIIEDGLFMILFSIVLRLCMPILALLIPYWILQKIFGEKIGGGIAIGVILIVCFGCLIVDIAEIVGMFMSVFGHDRKSGGDKTGAERMEDNPKQ